MVGGGPTGTAWPNPAREDGDAERSFGMGAGDANGAVVGSVGRRFAVSRRIVAGTFGCQATGAAPGGLIRLRLTPRGKAGAASVGRYFKA